MLAPITCAYKAALAARVAFDANAPAHLTAPRRAAQMKAALVAASASLEGGGWLLDGHPTSSGRAPICVGHEYVYRRGEMRVVVCTGYDSNGPGDVWDYLTIYSRDERGEDTRLTGLRWGY